MPPKKAAKKTAKKAAKKSAPQHDEHKRSKDKLRTFEHLGRVQALTELSAMQRENITQIGKLADAAFRLGEFQQSADLLRAAEHLSFAAIYGKAKDEVDDALHQTIRDEVTRLHQRAAEHAAHHQQSRPIKAHMTRMQSDADKALDWGFYRAALELARGAEALAHVNDVAEKHLPPPAKRLLRGA